MTISTASTAAIAALEAAINRALDMDQTTAERLGQLENDVFHIRCEMPEIDLYILPGQGYLKLLGNFEGVWTVQVCGPASEFVRVFTASDKGVALINGGLNIRGDSAALQKLQDALSGLEVDWESHLATVIGDIPAHQLGRVLRGSIHWGGKARSSLLRQAEEFIHEEARFAPSRSEVEDFDNRIKKLDSGAMRLRRKLRQLERRFGET